MGQADGSPDQQVCETSESKEPAEDVTTLTRLTNEGQQTEGELDDDAIEGTALGVDVSEEPGSHAALGHGLHGAGRSKGAGVCDTENGDGDDSVEDGGEDLDAGVLDGKHEGRGLGVGTAGAQQAGVVRGEDEAEDEEVDDVEEGNSEEDLLASLGDGLAGVGGLGGGEANHLSTTEGEGGNNKDGAESSEAVAESTRLDPVLAANVALVAGTAAVDDDTEDHEANTGEDLDEGEDELDFTVAADTKELDDDKRSHEHANPDTHVNIVAPEFDCQRGGNQLEGEDCEPGNGVLPAHCETPRRIDEADEVCVEGTVDGVEDSHFSEGVGHHEQHGADDGVADDE